MPPGFGIHRWAFVARNRLIAALARVVVVVEATERSGSLTTADLGAELGRTVAAVPGRVTCATAERHQRPDPRRRGARARRAQRRARRAGRAHRRRCRASRARAPGTTAPAELEARLRRVLDAIGAGHSTLPMLVGTRRSTPRAVLAGLGELEARGLVRRGFGGRYVRVP